MRKLFLLIFSLLVTLASAQVSDDFSDGDFSTDPTWAGTDANFIVNTAGQLQLNATLAGNSYLSTGMSVSVSDTNEWRMNVRLGFSPSSSNYSRIYLSSDQADLNSPLNGFYLQLGESLSNDAIELFSQTGSTSTSICRGNDGQIASAFDVGLKILRDPSGEWNIYVDPNGGEDYQFSSSGQETSTPVLNYCGISCMYTSGNIQNFYFDNIYAGKYVPDLIAPLCTALNVLSDSSLTLNFSEPLNISSALNPNSYFLNNGIGNPSSFLLDSINGFHITLYFNQHFIADSEYQLHLSGLNDISSNQIVPVDLSFKYYSVAIGNINDIVFSEIYFEMSSISPLPNSEYVEIYNRNDSAIQLRNWIVTDGSTEAQLPEFLLQPHDYAVIFPEQNASLFTGIDNPIAVSSFPGLNNDTGDSLSLTQPNGAVVNQIVFSDDTYHDNTKKNGGWSLEKIDLNFPCQDENNWKASISTSHGSPGNQNSVNGIYKDESAPFIKNVWLSDSTRLEIEFSEMIGNEMSTGDFSVKDGNENIFSPDSIFTNGTTGIALKFSSAFTSQKYELKISGTFSDCAGNQLDLSHVVYFGFAEEAEAGDIILNEILFDPYDGGTDFLEIYNRSAKIIDLHRWTVKEANYDNENSVKEEALITVSHKLIFPGEYLALTADQEKVCPFYSCNNRFAFLQVEDMPDFNSDEGTALLFDETGTRMDGFHFSDSLHFPLINIPKGVSLERLTNNIDYTGSEWHSASASAGFGTPGYRNSQWLELSSNNESIKPEPEVFSPDNDGYYDVLSIHYHFPKTGTVLTLIVMDALGRTVRTILNNETVDTEGFLSWDGITDDRHLAFPGRYLLVGRSFDLDGNSSLIKKSCVVAMKTN